MVGLSILSLERRKWCLEPIYSESLKEKELKGRSSIWDHLRGQRNQSPIGKTFEIFREIIFLFESRIGFRRIINYRKVILFFYPNVEIILFYV